MRLASRRFENLLAVLLSLSALGLFLLLALPLIRGQVYIYDDLGWTHLRSRQFYARALASGSNFLWDPSILCGFYLQGEGQAGLTHPLHFLLYCFLPLARAFNLEFLISYPVMFAGMWWLLWRWKLPRHAALLGAFTFTFGGFNLLHYMHMNAVAVISHIPWLIGLADVLIAAESPREMAAAQAGIALLTGSQWLLGYPQYVWFSSLAEASYVLWKTSGDRSRGRLWWWLLAKTTGGLIGMVQILPTLESVRSSVRQNPSMDFRMSLSLHPMNLLQLWSPLSLRGHNYGRNAHELGLYSGCFTTAALAWPFVRWKGAEDRWEALKYACAAFACVMLLFAMGRYGWIYPWIARLPLVNLFRIPARHIVLVHLAMSILAAIAFAELASVSRREQRIPWKALWPLAIPGLLSMATLAAALWALGSAAGPGAPALLRPETYSSAGRVLTGTALLLAAVILTLLAARGRRWSLVCLVALAGVDLLYQGADYLRYPWIRGADTALNTPPMTIEEFLRTVPDPPDAAPGRLAFPKDWMWINALTMKGYSLADGYVALKPARTLDARSGIYRRLANVRWAVADYRWQKISDPMPRVRMVSRTAAPPADADVDRFDIAHAAWTDPPVDLQPGEPGAARIDFDLPGYIDVSVSSPSRQLLVVSESFHPGWQAAQDGRPIEVLRAYGDFMACPVDAGRHRVELRFQPSSFIWGAWLSALGLAALACSTLWLLAARKSF